MMIKRSNISQFYVNVTCQDRTFVWVFFKTLTAGPHGSADTLSDMLTLTSVVIWFRVELSIVCLECGNTWREGRNVHSESPRLLTGTLKSQFVETPGSRQQINLVRFRERSRLTLK